MMKHLAERLQSIIDQHIPALRQIPESTMADKPIPGKWSKKEILGHLADSAHSNSRRFVVAQYEDKPFIVYNQDKWVAIMNYQQWPSGEIADLWYVLNKQICYILQIMTDDVAQRECQTQSLHTIAWLAEDYIKHLLHHLHVILDLEPVPYP